MVFGNFSNFEWFVGYVLEKGLWPLRGARGARGVFLFLTSCCGLLLLTLVFFSSCELFLRTLCVSDILSASSVSNKWVLKPPNSCRGMTLHRLLEMFPCPLPYSSYDVAEADRLLLTTGGTTDSLTVAASLAATSSVHAVLAHLVVKVCRCVRGGAVRGVLNVVHRWMLKMYEEELTDGLLDHWDTSREGGGGEWEIP